MEDSYYSQTTWNNLESSLHSSACCFRKHPVHCYLVFAHQIRTHTLSVQIAITVVTYSPLTPKGPIVPIGTYTDFGHVPTIWKKVHLYWNFYSRLALRRALWAYFYSIFWMYVVWVSTSQSLRKLPWSFMGYVSIDEEVEKLRASKGLEWMKCLLVCKHWQTTMFPMNRT